MGWVILAVAVWFAVAVAVAVVIGRVVRRRDLQRPGEPVDVPGRRRPAPQPAQEPLPTRIASRLGRRR